MATRTAKKRGKRVDTKEKPIEGKFKVEKVEEAKPDEKAAPDKRVARIEPKSPQEIAQWRPEFAKADVDRAIVQVEEKRRFFDQVMKSGSHYAIIPGQRPTKRINQATGDVVKDAQGHDVYDAPKPALLKPGAELLNAAMGLHPVLEDEYPPTMEPRADGELFIQFRRMCRIYLQTGPGEEDRMLVAQASGECNSWESKYRYRGQSGRVCPHCGEAAIIKGNPQFAPRVGGKREGPKLPGYEQGGWLCWKKKDGCGATFPDNDPIGQQETTREKNPNPMDQANTILKMADKRALVAATLLATGCSDLFTQDIEDGITQPAGPAPTAAGGIVEGEEDPGPPPDAAGSAPSPVVVKQEPKGSAPAADQPDPSGWELVMPFQRWRIEHQDHPLSRTFVKFLKDHNFNNWSTLKAAWGMKCQIEADKEAGLTIKDEVLFIIGGLKKPFDPDDVISDEKAPATAK